MGFKKPLQTQPESRQFEFKALPLNSKLFEVSSTSSSALDQTSSITNSISDVPVQPIKIAPKLTKGYMKQRNHLLKQRKVTPASSTQFHALPMPAFDTFFKPKKSEAQLVEPDPFPLQSEVRGSAYMQKFRATLLEKEKLEEDARKFKARNMPIFDQPVPSFCPCLCF